MSDHSQLDLPDDLRDDLPDAVKLDLDLACAAARRDVFAAHGMTEQADAWHGVAVMLANRRAARRLVADAVDDACLPSIDLGELPDDDTGE